MFTNSVDLSNCPITNISTAQLALSQRFIIDIIIIAILSQSMILVSKERLETTISDEVNLAYVPCNIL